ncbi:MAG: hypothetical protein QXG36_00425 [Nitrososphaeria archaeon]
MSDSERVAVSIAYWSKEVPILFIIFFIASSSSKIIKKMDIIEEILLKLDAKIIEYEVSKVSEFSLPRLYDVQEARERLFELYNHIIDEVFSKVSIESVRRDNIRLENTPLVVEAFVFEDERFDFKISFFDEIEGLEYALGLVENMMKSRRIMYNVCLSGKVSVKEVSVVGDSVVVVLE